MGVLWVVDCRNYSGEAWARGAVGIQQFAIANSIDRSFRKVCLKLFLQGSVLVFIFAETAVQIGLNSSIAQEPTIAFEASMASAVLDRGEQTGGESLELAVALEQPVKDGLLYGTVYRRVILDDESNSFEDETDFSVGIVWLGAGFAADVSANWIIYPGESSDDSLELGVAFDFDLPLSPFVASFYDVHSED